MPKAQKLRDTPDADLIAAVVTAVEHGFVAMLALRAAETPKDTGLDGWHVSSTDMGGKDVNWRASKVIPVEVCRNGAVDRPRVMASRRAVTVLVDCAAVVLDVLGNDSSKLFCFERLGATKRQPTARVVTRQDIRLRRAISRGLGERFPGSRWTRSSFEF